MAKNPDFEKLVNRDRQGKFADKNKPTRTSANAPILYDDDPPSDYVCYSSLAEWQERRQDTPGCSDMGRILLQGKPPSEPFEVEPGSHLDNVLNFGHQWEPRIVSQYAKEHGLRERAEDTPIEDLNPGEITRYNLAVYDLQGKAHASLDAVQRNHDGTVTIVEVKTGGYGRFDRLPRGRRSGYYAQAKSEQTITGASSVKILYAHRPYEFESMSDREIAEDTLNSIEEIPMDGTRTDNVTMWNGRSLSDLDLDGLLTSVDHAENGVG